MILELGKAASGFAVHMPGSPIGLHYVCPTEEIANDLADAHERQHGMRPAVTPVVVRVDTRGC